MTKKFLSLVLSLALVIGLIPMMTVSAESEIDKYYTFDEFTNKIIDFNTKALSSYDTGASEAYNKSITIGGNLSLRIFEMAGYDGKMTNVGEITINSSAIYEQTPGSLRFLGNKTTSTVEGVHIQEMDVYITDNPNTEEFYMLPTVIKGKKIGFGNSKDKYTYGKELTPGWHRVKSVTLINGADENNVIGYVDGKVVTYKKYKLSSAYKSFQLDTHEQGYKTIIFDNIKLWSNPDKTTASSVFSDASAVPANSIITVDFTEMVLDVPDVSPATVSTQNVIMTNSDGDNVDLARVTVGADRKSIVIEPLSDLKKEMKYNVKVTKLKDIYDQQIDDYEFSFTTAGDTNLAISDPEFSVVDFDALTNVPVDRLQEGLINASYTVQNNASFAKSIVMLAVLKDEDTIERFQIKSVTIDANSEVSFNGGFKIENPETQKMEVYIWDDMCNMTPLAVKYVIDATSTTVVPE